MNYLKNNQRAGWYLVKTTFEDADFQHVLGSQFLFFQKMYIILLIGMLTS